MHERDDTDAEILRLLVEDARRPYSDIADVVDLSAPAVRDRIERLREVGIIRRFTVDVDRSQLRAGVPVLIDVAVVPSAVERVRTALEAADGVEHVFVTADAHVVIPMSGVVDSLNLAVSTALLLYEAVRQRNDER
jgi:DNA-binding Lrp family transcriptional regulator